MWYMEYTGTYRVDHVNDSVYSKALSLDLSKDQKLQTNC